MLLCELIKHIISLKNKYVISLLVMHDLFKVLLNSIALAYMCSSFITISYHSAHHLFTNTNIQVVAYSA